MDVVGEAVVAPGAGGGGGGEMLHEAVMTIQRVGWIVVGIVAEISEVFDDADEAEFGHEAMYFFWELRGGVFGGKSDLCEDKARGVAHQAGVAGPALQGGAVGAVVLVTTVALVVTRALVEEMDVLGEELLDFSWGGGESFKGFAGEEVVAGFELVGDFS